MGLDYSPDELITVVLARQLRNGWKGVTPYAPVLTAACLLARASHAPDLWFWTGTLGLNAQPDRLYPTGTDPRYLASVEAILDFYDVFEYGETGCDFMFYSGLQVDRFGNANNVEVGGPGTGRPLRRGGGQANTSHPLVDAHLYLFVPDHRPDVLVDRVDFVSIVGHLDGPGAREQNHLSGGGPELCVTDIAVMDFDPGTCSMRLKSVHAGHTVEETLERTGFDLPIHADVGETAAPTVEELDVVRRIDPDGILRGGR